ncbi:glycosyltransferase family 4 protein [Candidatus Hadarchaeum sp.]|uniref:glycosyltransferase family 4 protein n=1 Tax=Candidatus Hadarchaeum sp. TaxID=2883567 RepID=UPI003D0FBEB2
MEMRILHVNPFYYPYQGGTEKYLYDLCRRLARRNSVSVITSKFGGNPEFEVIEGTKVYRLKSLVLQKLPPFLPPPLAIPFSFRSNMIKICKKEKPDVIHIHNRFFLSYSSMVLWKKSLGVPLFITLHNARPVGINEETDLLGQLFDDYVGQRIIRSCDRVLANSRWTLETTLPKDYPRERAEVIYNGVDTQRFRRVKSNLKDRFGCEFLSVTVCRLLPQKGVKYLIAAVNEIEEDYKAVIIGRGPCLGELKSLVKKLGLEKKVEFITDYLTDEDLVKYYSASDFSILPSLWEPFGITLVESMACGCPVIATNVGGIPEVVTSDCGILVSPRSPSEIAVAVSKLIGDKNLRRRLGRNARKRVERHFDFDIIAEKVEQSYQRHLEGAG